jgi:hypothetical protein
VCSVPPHGIHASNLSNPVHKRCLPDHGVTSHLCRTRPVWLIQHYEVSNPAPTVGPPSLATAMTGRRSTKDRTSDDRAFERWFSARATFTAGARHHRSCIAVWLFSPSAPVPMRAGLLSARIALQYVLYTMAYHGSKDTAPTGIASRQCLFIDAILRWMECQDVSSQSSQSLRCARSLLQLQAGI